MASQMLMHIRSQANGATYMHALVALHDLSAL